MTGMPAPAAAAAADTGIILDVQCASTRADVPSQDALLAWTRAALGATVAPVELTIRMVDEEEGADLNQRYRGRPGPTNVLSFPFEPPPGLSAWPLLGDLVICAPLVAREAEQQGKAVTAHWAHMVVHGILHLRGFDHLTEADAERMETLETHILAGLGFPPPYAATAGADDKRPI